MAEKMQGADKSREVFSTEAGNVVSIAYGAEETWHIQCTSSGLCPQSLKPAAWEGSLDCKVHLLRYTLSCLAQYRKEQGCKSVLCTSGGRQGATYSVQQLLSHCLCLPQLLGAARAEQSGPCGCLC